MNANDFKVRRATIEDLPALNALWKTMDFGVLELEKRLTEFQVAVDSNGSVAGAIGYQMQGKQALIHSEAFTDFSANHGTVRVWSQEDSRFWAQETLTKPDADALEKLPANWAAQPGTWHTLKLREDVEEVLSLDKEFAMFAEAERERSRSALNQAKVLKTIATVIALILGLVVLVGVGLMLMHKYRPPAQ
jgi:hypothetical protein